MRPQQALQVIENILNQLKFNRDENSTVFGAVEVLRQTIGKTNNAIPKPTTKAGKASKEA